MHSVIHMLSLGQMLEKLGADPSSQCPAAKEALTELATLFDLLAHMQGLHNIEFNMSLARGLDYYTGVIYEAVMTKSWNGGQPQVGSVAAGGRCVVANVLLTTQIQLAVGHAMIRSTTWCFTC